MPEKQLKERLNLLQETFQSLSLRYHRCVLAQNASRETDELIGVICNILAEISQLRRELGRSAPC